MIGRMVRNGVYAINDRRSVGTSGVFTMALEREVQPGQNSSAMQTTA